MFKLNQAKLSVLRIQQERDWRDAQLSASDIEINKRTDLGQNALAWRAYRIALRNWPEHANFPDPAFRPNPPQV